MEIHVKRPDAFMQALVAREDALVSVRDESNVVVLAPDVNVHVSMVNASAVDAFFEVMHNRVIIRRPSMDRIEQFKWLINYTPVVFSIPDEITQAWVDFVDDMCQAGYIENSTEFARQLDSDYDSIYKCIRTGRCMCVEASKEEVRIVVDLPSDTGVDYAYIIQVAPSTEVLYQSGVLSVSHCGKMVPQDKYHVYFDLFQPTAIKNLKEGDCIIHEC